MSGGSKFAEYPPDVRDVKILFFLDDKGIGRGIYTFQADCTPKGRTKMRKIFLAIFCFFICFAFSIESPAQIYKYVDKNGVIHFTDTPTDPKYISKSEGRKDRESDRTWKYQRLINEALAEFENPARTNSEEKAVCTKAVRLLKMGLKEKNNQDTDDKFLDAIERAIKNCKTIGSGYHSRIICHSGDAFALLEKAKAIKGIADGHSDTTRKLERRIDDLEDDISATKAQIPIR